MSKIVVVLGPGGASDFLTVDDSETSVTWAVGGGALGNTLPIETYFCEGEEFYFARLETRPHGEMLAASVN
ncbi:hypothetical protein ACUY4R_002547 [Kosakonia sp. BK9b]